jgi:hypothetical protein
MRKHAKSPKKPVKTWLPWLLIVLGFLVAIILMGIIIAVVSVHLSANQHGGWPDTIQQLKSSLVDLFVLAAAAILAAFREMK